MNFGKIAKQFAFKNGFGRKMKAEDGEDLIDRNFAPGKLEKANDALEKLKDQMSRKWKIDEDDD